VEVPLDVHSGLKTASAQLSKDGKKGMVLLDATDESRPVLASPKGLYADVPRVTGMSAFQRLGPKLMLQSLRRATVPSRWLMVISP
jgi:hypothetical protein